MRRILRRAGWISASVLATGGAVLLAWAWSTQPKTDGVVRLSSISGEVEIFRDESGVPHIFASTANDGYFGLGYAHSQDRFWQMEFTRRLGAGRLAEVVGDAGLSADRFMRLLGLYRQAESAVASLSPRTLAALEAYVAGVNAWLEHRTATLPPEFALLNYDPEPWRIADSIVWGQLLAYQLSTNWHGELYRAGLIRNLSPEQVAELWPGDPPDAPITLEAARRTALFDTEGILDAVPNELKSYSASNAWVLGGARSATGAPILANDPHLGFTAPNTWYLARIETPEMSVVGATAPGVPFTVLGHNGHVAWGMTSTGGDTQDIFVETVSPDDPSLYLTPDGAQPFETRDESIEVKGQPDVVLSLRATRHGPVVSDILEDSNRLAGDGTVLALASASSGTGSRTIEAMAGMPRARDAGAFERIASDFQTPLVNIFFADRHGTIGMVTPGLVPLRKSGDGRYPVDGASGDFDWNGFVPAAAMPRIVDPAAAFIVNANNRLVGPEYPYMIARNWDDPYRAERIHEIIGQSHKHSVPDTMGEQGDILSVAARELVPRMVAATGMPDGIMAEQALALLRKWDFRMTRDGPEPLIYTAWLRHAVRHIAGDELDGHLAGYWRPRPAFVRYVLDEGRHWCDAGDCGPVLGRALEDALDEISAALGENPNSWKWGDLHNARFEHPVFGRLPVIGKFSTLSIPTSGGDNTIGRGMTAGKGEEPYAHIHGAGYKAVYDLADLANSRFMIPAGQSGNPFSRHYSDLLEAWRDGEYFRISGDREDLAAAGYERLLLSPAEP